MEEIQNEMRSNSHKKFALAAARAGEKAMKHPQLMDSNRLVPSDPKGLPRGGGEAGLARLIGSAKPRGRKAKGASNGMMEHEDISSDEEMEGGAKHQGRMFAEHLLKMHGGAYMHKFVKGMGRSEMPVIPMGRQVVHASQSPAGVGIPGQAMGGQDVPPGGLPAVAYGNPPQAPASFERNTVGMGMCGKGKLSITHGEGKLSITHGAGRRRKAVEEVAAPVSGGRRAERGAQIKKLMAENGMTLGQASRHLKEMGAEGRPDAVQRLMRENGMTLAQAHRYLKEMGDN
jgi:hypothetical protein